MARKLQAALTLATYAAASAYRDPFALALNIARKTPSGLRGKLTHWLQSHTAPTAQAAGLLLADRAADAREVLDRADTTGEGDASAAHFLRDWVALGARYQGNIPTRAVAQRRAWEMGQLSGSTTGEKAYSTRGLLGRWYTGESAILRGEWHPSHDTDHGARERLHHRWQELSAGGVDAREETGGGAESGSVDSSDGTAGLIKSQQSGAMMNSGSPAGLVRPLFVLTNSYPHSQAGYAQRTHKLLSCIQQQLMAARAGADGAADAADPNGDRALDEAAPVAALTRYGYPAIIGALDTGPNQVDAITYTRHIPGIYSPSLRRRMEARTQKIVEQAIAHGATIIHATTDYDNGIPALAAAKRLGLPFVYEMRGERERSWVASLPEDVREKAADSERYRALRALEAQLAEDADLVLVLSEVHKQALGDRGISGPIVVVPNGTDAASLTNTTDKASARKELGLPTDALLVGTITAVVDYEGLDLLVEVAEKLQSTYPHARVVIVGDGVALPGLKAAAEDKGLNNIIFPGRVPPEVAATYYAALDIFCVPRIDTDVTRTITPLKSIPALAKGMPVLVSDLPALKEITPPEAPEWALPREGKVWTDAIVTLAGEMGTGRDRGPQQEHPKAAHARAFAASRTWEAAAATVINNYPQTDTRPLAGQEHTKGKTAAHSAPAGAAVNNAATPTPTTGRDAAQRVSGIAAKAAAGITQPRRVLAAITTRIPYRGRPLRLEDPALRAEWTIDVIVPSYKSAQHLPTLMDSLVAQTLPKERFRVLVILNGPDDGSEEILRPYAEKMDLSILHCDTANAGAARNVGLDHVTGDYVTFVDADDYVEPDYLEALLEVAGPTRVAVAPLMDEGRPSHYSRKTAAMGDREFPLWQQSWALAFTAAKALPANLATAYRFDESLRGGEDVVYMCELLQCDALSITGTSSRGPYQRTLRADSLSRVVREAGELRRRRREVIFRLRLLRLTGPRRIARNERCAAQQSLA